MLNADGIADLIEEFLGTRLGRLNSASMYYQTMNKL